MTSLMSVHSYLVKLFKVGNTTMSEVTGVSVSDAAAKRIAAILKSEPDKTALRISVEGGGCSGFSYKYDLVDGAAAEDDIVIEKNGARVLIDTVSLPYMDGSEIDFVDDLIGQSFQIKNPHAVASCGCGTSFSI
ncbi:heme biosynthesis protein HemY [Brucella endophytica]|uniref:Heme biosynthesis protein HemY n=1 Tax=Brucella endophytica TaxID=1963359 RepID=A0A916S738_9HYPH|nr:heme biosynthesis protein HemY [Brucella endophytica]